LTLAKVILDCRLVIAVDTMGAHLAGALNVPTWTLLKRDCDWRWMVDRMDTPWYPSMRLYRQHIPGAWGPVLSQVSRDLRTLVADSDGSPATRIAS
jgi:ADP-heptose:LPS heptosyltransferase